MRYPLCIALCVLFLCPSIHAVTIAASFWSKETCKDFCLPSSIGQTTTIEIAEPEVGSFTTLVVPSALPGLSAKLGWFKKAQAGGYSAFQVELILDGEIIGLCTRYEGLSSLENIPVGACGAKNPNENSMLGFTIGIPEGV